jgi:hypothetical protein
MPIHSLHAIYWGVEFATTRQVTAHESIANVSLDWGGDAAVSRSLARLAASASSFVIAGQSVVDAQRRYIKAPIA